MKYPFTRSLRMPANLGLFLLCTFWNIFWITTLDLRTISPPPSNSRWSAAVVSAKESPSHGEGIPTQQLLNVTAIAEQTVYLNCKTSRKDAEKLEWRRDNQLLPANHRQYVFPNGTLLIKAVDARLDSGYYTCRLDRGNGAVSQQFEYHLLVIIPPRIDPLLFPADLSPLARVRVSCLVSRGDPPISIQWLKDGHSLTQAAAAEQGIVLQDIDEYASFLAIASLNVNHAGNYTCLASNKAAQDSKTARLTVNVPAYWVQEPSDAFALYKTDLRLTCQANGTPKPVIEWKKAVTGSLGNYAPVSAAGRSLLMDNGTLLLQSVERTDEGSYLCQATNGIGPAISKVVQLTVKAPAYFLTDKETITIPLGSAASLECRAYGDLPITVTWSYKGLPLKEGSYDRLAFQSQNLPDGIRSTLKISRSQRGDSGSYSCKITNEYGSSTKELTFLVQEAPEAPRDLVVTATNSRMANVVWIGGYDGSSSIINFIVEWKRQSTSPLNGDVKWTTEHTPGNSSSHTLKNLRPASRYDIRVRAENLLGQSVPSPAVQILTDEEAPSEVPRDVVATASSSTSINLTWKPPTPEAQNGALQGYIVGYRVENSSDAFAYKTVKSDGKRDEAISLRDLRKYTPYTVVLQAYNAMGSGPKLQKTGIWTQEDVPVEAPRSISATAESAQRISITWEQLPQESINGLLLGYKVLFKPLTDWTSQPDIKIVQDTSCVLDGLRKFSNYTIQVLAFTSVGDGVVSPTTYAQTLPDVPSHPADIKALVTSPSSVLVTWSEPEEKNGVIKQYNVYLRLPTGKKDKKRVVYPDGSLNKYEFRDLTTNTQYEFWVTAETDVGEGAASFRLKQAPETTGPAKIASFPVVVSSPIGGSAVLPCMAVGSPTPTIDWWKGNRIIRNNGIIDILVNGSLSMKNIQTSDAGQYTCKAKNLYGEDAVEITLHVQRPPVPPNVTIVATALDSLVIEWRMLYDGGAIVKGYTLYYRPASGTWKSIRLPANFQTYTLKHLLCGQTYQVYLTAYNDVGPSESSDTVTASTTGHAPISSDLQSLLVPNSSSVVVFLSTWKSGGCPVQSFAIKYQAYQDTVEWKTVGNLIPGDAESITISDLSPEMLYRMKVTAVNEAGTTEQEYMFGTLTENGEMMMPEVVLQKEKSVLPFHKDSSKIYPLITGVLVLLVLFVVVIYVNIRRRYQKFPSNDMDANLRRDITTQALRRLDSPALRYMTPSKSASMQSPWQSAGQFSADPKHHAPICLPSPARQWQAPLRNNDPLYGSPKRLNTAVRPQTEIIQTRIELDGHYQTPSNRTIKRDESTPDSGFSGSNLKHTDGSHGSDSFRRESIPRYSTGSTSDSDNLHKLNLSLLKNRPKPMPRRRPQTRPRHMGTASLLRTKQTVVSSSSPSSAEDLPYAYSTGKRMPRTTQPEIKIRFPSPPHSDYEDAGGGRQWRPQEAYNLQHRYSVNVHASDGYGPEDMVDEPLQPTTTV